MTPEFLSRPQLALTASSHFIVASVQYLFRGKVRLTGDSY
jgi:hypothetical protein